MSAGAGFWDRLILSRLAEPRRITALQIGSHLSAAAAGALVMLGAFPYLFRGISPAVSFCVGLVLVVGGLLGVMACSRGVWWLERVALRLVALGWLLLVPSVVAVHLHVMFKAFIFIMLAVALFDVGKRYRRIDWAYLDPTK